MKLDYLLFVRDNSGCIASCPEPPPCACAADETCFQINRSCTTCFTNKCVPNSPPAKSSGGVSKAALAGGVVAAIVLITAIAFFAWWYRRRLIRDKAATPKNEIKEAPARAEDVLNRPDPNEKQEVAEENNFGMHSSVSNYAINLDSNSRYIIGQAIGSPSQSPRESVQSNPFGDAHSIQTTSTSAQGTNVIPIALVAPGSVSSAGSSPSTQLSLNPTRPDRTPDQDLNLDHLNVSREGTPHSQASGGGSEVSNRNSYLSSMSYASDFLNEVPMIVTPTRGTVRQVLGVVKAEVIQTSPSPSSSESNLKPPITTRPSVRSPLAGSSFGPADVLDEVDEEQDISARQDPFDDNHSANPDSHLPSYPTFSNQPSSASIISDWSPDSPSLPWAHGNENSRPSSMSTQAGSIIADIGSATRVQVGLQQLRSNPHTPVPTTVDSFKTQHRMTSARLVSPPNQGKSVGTLEQQQQKASTAARQDNNRVSSGSVLSTTSTRADSILESFHFVPPSPISDRPARVAPRSPLAQHSPDDRPSEPASPLPMPPDRRTLGMSTGSEISTMSAGLGAFPFQMDSLTPGDNSSSAPTSVNGPQRASLDTLALTSDLSSYPLGFDKELKDNYPLRKM